MPSSNIHVGIIQLNFKKFCFYFRINSQHPNWKLGHEGIQEEAANESLSHGKRIMDESEKAIFSLNSIIKKQFNLKIDWIDKWDYSNSSEGISRLYRNILKTRYKTSNRSIFWMQQSLMDVAICINGKKIKIPSRLILSSWDKTTSAEKMN